MAPNLHKHSIIRAALLAAAVCVLASCVYGPPLPGLPDDPRQPIIYDELDVSPREDRPVIINLAEEGDVTFELSNVYLASEANTIEYTWGYVNPDQPNTFAQLETGRVTERAEQNFRDITVFSLPPLSLQRCVFPLVAANSTIQVRLRINHLLPPEDRVIPGVESYQTSINWVVIIRGDCPDD